MARQSLVVPGFADRIKTRLRELGTTTNAFAVEKKIPQLSRYMNGAVPSFPSLEGLADALGVPWQWLLVDDQGAEIIRTWREAQPTEALPTAPSSRPASSAGEGQLRRGQTKEAVEVRAAPKGKTLHGPRKHHQQAR